MSPITHLPHPEDAILTGDLTVLSDIQGDFKVSAKMDGSPALVWGKHPETGKFFVSTKSAFNKKKIKICYELDDIREYFPDQPELRDVLWTCLKDLPDTDNIYQGDFIGFGGRSVYTPNTLVYEFDYRVKEDIIVAPHLIYSGSYLPTAEPRPITQPLESTKKCLFVQPTVDRVPYKKPKVRIDSSRIDFLDIKQAAEATKSINFLIRRNVPLLKENLLPILGDERLVDLFMVVTQIKNEIMKDIIVYDAPRTSLPDGKVVPSEGYVIYTPDGRFYKLVDRYVFSKANFNNGKFDR